MRITHPNLPKEVEFFPTGESRAGGSFYSFYMMRKPKILMSLCKNFKSEEEALEYWQKVYEDKKYVEALLYLYRAT